jgi:hypothetical protein
LRYFETSNFTAKHYGYFMGFWHLSDPGSFEMLFVAPLQKFLGSQFFSVGAAFL